MPFIFLLTLGKDLFDRSHNLPHSIFYPDVLKIKTIIVVKQIFEKIAICLLITKGEGTSRLAQLIGRQCD